MIEGYSPNEATKAYEASLGKEIGPEIRTLAHKLVGAFALKRSEDFLVITDGDVVRVNPDIVRAIEEESRKVIAELSKDAPERVGHFRLLVVPPAEHSAVAFSDACDGYLTSPGHKAVLILTRMSRSWSPETQAAAHPERGLGDMLNRREATFDESKLKAVAKRRSARIISITKAADRDVLTTGAALEFLPDIKGRSEKVAELMEGVVRAHITNDAGTDLWVNLRQEYSGVEVGDVSKPGSLTNFPVGEWYVLPRQKGTHGTLVIHDAPMGGAIRQEMMNGKTVKMELRDGQLLKIEDVVGEGMAAKLHDYLEAGRNSEDIEHGDPFKIAEFAIGTNTRAWRETEAGQKLPPTSVEAEKAYGTAHVAFGANGVYGQPADDSEMTNVQTHADCTILRPTIECFREDSTSFFILRNGEPQGY